MSLKKQKSGNIIIVKKMQDYSDEPAFKKQAEDAIKFLKKHGLPGTFKKKKG